jgi:hypothetical protein
MKTEIMMRPTSTDPALKKARTTKLHGSEPWVGPKRDAPGTYDISQLKQLLLDYLAGGSITGNRIRDILLPACLKNTALTVEQFRKAFVEFDSNYDEEKIPCYITQLSAQLGVKKNDFLRQVIEYEYPHRHWEKDNFSIKDQYRQLVAEVLEQLKHPESHQSVRRKEPFGTHPRKTAMFLLLEVR